MHRFLFALWVVLTSCSPAPRPTTATTTATTIRSEPSESTSLPPGTPITPIECREHAEIAFPAALAACATAADCIAVEHGLDCCGGVMITGIAAIQHAAFDEIEARCRTAVTFRTCHCAAGVTTQLGERVTSSPPPYHVACVSNACVAFASEPAPAAVQQQREPTNPSGGAGLVVRPGPRGPIGCAGTPCGNACCEGSQQCINGPVGPGHRMCWPPPPSASCRDGGGDECLQPPPPVQ